MKKYLFFMSIIACVLYSCNIDEEQNFTEASHESELTNLKEYSLLVEPDFPNVAIESIGNLTRSNMEDSTQLFRSRVSKETTYNDPALISRKESSIVSMTGYGYTNTSIALNMAKCYYRSNSPIMLGVGLAGGTYFVEVVRVTKTLYSYRAGDIIIPTPPIADDKDMGTQYDGYFETTLGWTSNEVLESGDGVFIGTTHLIHFLYTMSGAQLDKYYPCCPDSLVWRYSSMEMNNGN